MKKRIVLVQLVVVLGICTLSGSAATFDPDDLYVSSGAIDVGTVDRFDISGSPGALVESVTPSLTAIPRGSAFAPDGKLWVSVINGIIRYDESGIVDTLSSGVTGAEELIFGPDGNAYLVDRYGDVNKFDGTTGADLGVFLDYRNTIPGANPLTVNGLGLIFGPDPNNYVYLSVNHSGTLHTIERFDGTTGAYVDRFLTLPQVSGNLPAGMAFGRGNMFFVAAYYGDSVLRYEVNSGVADDPNVFVYGGIGGPWDVELGPDGTLYVTSSSAGTVVSYDLDDARNSTYITGLASPSYMVIPEQIGPGACGDLWNRYPVGDLSEDCSVDMEDFGEFAEHWMDCTDPNCII